jgi:hypothetical protein
MVTKDAAIPIARDLRVLKYHHSDKQSHVMNFSKCLTLLDKLDVGTKLASGYSQYYIARTSLTSLIKRVRTMCANRSLQFSLPGYLLPFERGKHSSY